LDGILHGGSAVGPPRLGGQGNQLLPRGRRGGGRGRGSFELFRLIEVFDQPTAR
jgi:hypothetical protein